MPSPAKAAFPTLGALYEQVEAEVLRKLDLFPDLSVEERFWLRAVDTLDLLLWAMDEIHAGNKSMWQMYAACRKVLDDRRALGTLPTEVYEYYVGVAHLNLEERQNDYWDKALTDGLG